MPTVLKSENVIVNPSFTQMPTVYVDTETGEFYKLNPKTGERHDINDDTVPTWTQHVPNDRDYDRCTSDWAAEIARMRDPENDVHQVVLHGPVSLATQLPRMGAECSGRRGPNPRTPVRMEVSVANGQCIVNDTKGMFGEAPKGVHLANMPFIVVTLTRAS